MLIHAATANTAESDKRGLLPQSVRSGLVLAWAKREGFDFLCVQESGTVLRAAMRRLAARVSKQATKRQGYAAHYSPASAHGGAGRRRGNGVLWRRAEWRLVAARDDKVRWPDSPTGYLYIPVVLLESRTFGVGLQVVVASVHAPTKRADRDGSTRRAINAKVLELVAQCREKGIPLIVGGDFNDGNLFTDLKLRNKGALKVANQHGPDWLLTTGRVIHGSRQTVDMKRLRLSDHAAVSAKVQVHNSP